MTKQLMLNGSENNETPQKLLEYHARLIYEAYPRKVAPVAAKRAIVRILKKRTIGHAELLAAVQRYAKWVEQTLGMPILESMNFVPYPATWFNDGRWDDEPDPPSRPRRIQAPDGKYEC